MGYAALIKEVLTDQLGVTGVAASRRPKPGRDSIFIQAGPVRYSSAA